MRDEGSLAKAKAVTLFFSAAAILAFVVPVLAGGAGQSTLAAAAAGAQTCPTEAYTGQTINCTTTTGLGTVAPTVAPATSSSCPSGSGRTISVSYSSGHVIWAVGGLPSSAIGSTVSAYLDGVFIGSATVGANGCAAGSDSVCLKTGSDPFAAIDDSYTAFATLDVTGSEACLAAETSAPVTKSSSGLAFTGGEIALMVALALLLIVLGASVARLARQRRGLKQG